ncbi:hypothetical protein FRC08_017705 [Ceratobasidium sp. 394]|nr:hypothetical protein FRC08_017705 [Ceratobasidium sp. 394]
MNPEAPSSSSQLGPVLPDRFVPHPGVGAKFLAHGAAADIWLIDDTVAAFGPTEPPTDPYRAVTKVISKYVRISPEVMVSYRRGPNNQSTKDSLWKKFIEDYRSQVNLWRSIKHKNVVQIFDFEDAEGLNRREEFCANGTMRDRRWPADLGVYDMIHSVVTGLRHLHELEPPVIHGSLNAGKIYIGDDSTVKLGGFGLAILAQGFATLAPTVELNGICRWMSPELFEDGHEMILTWASDIWALGCTLYEVVTGNLPYSDCKHDIEVVRRIKRGTPPGRQDKQANPSYLWPVIEVCWTVAPDGRPSAYEILKEIVSTLRCELLSNTQSLY